MLYNISCLPGTVRGMTVRSGLDEQTPDEICKAVCQLLARQQLITQEFFPLSATQIGRSQAERTGDVLLRRSMRRAFGASMWATSLPQYTTHSL